MDDSGPVEVRFIGNEAALVYSNGVKVIRRQDGFGVHFFGSDGEVMVDRGKFRVIVKGKTIASYAGSEDKDTNCPAEVEKAEKLLLNNAGIRLYESKSHYEDFLSCVASRKKPVANEQIGGRSVICCHLMNQLYFNNTGMKWDPAKFSFTGGTGNPAWLTSNYRDWEKSEVGRSMYDNFPVSNKFYTLQTNKFNTINHEKAICINFSSSYHGIFVPCTG